MLSGGLARIREAINSIKPSERNAAHYIINNPEEIIHLSVQELSRKSQSSPSAIIRLCRNLGLDGYQDLRIRIAGDLQTENAQEDYYEIKPNDGIPTLIRSVTSNSVHSINETYKIIDPEAVAKAVHHLYQANRIDFYGVGASQLVALDAQQKFMRINKHCTAYSDTHLQLTSSVTLSEKDVAVAVSNSGETEPVIQMIEQAKKAGATTIGITSYGQNQLGTEVDIHLETICSESDIRSAATTSRLVQLTVIDILYTAVAGLNYHESVRYLTKSHQVIKPSVRYKK